MKKIVLLLTWLVLTSGCETRWVVPPANGRVLDVRSLNPIAGVIVLRQSSAQEAKTKTDSNGFFQFSGKRALELAIGDPVFGPVIYCFEAPDYKKFETNIDNYTIGAPLVKEIRHNLGDIQLTPK